MKNILCFLLLLPIFSFAQKVVKHTVVAGESLSSLAKQYKTNPKAIASFNNIDFKKGLAIGQVIKVQLPPNAAKVAAPKEIKVEKPVKETKALVKEKPEVKIDPKKTVAPTMHTVAAKETLYGLSKMYGVSVVDIKKWNKLTSDNLENGTEIIVGYGNKAKKQVVTEVQPANNTEPQSKNEPQPKKNPNPVDEKPIVKKVFDPTGGDEINTNTDGEGKDFKGGFFKSIYKDNGKAVEGVAGIFKSTSGWDDGKFYCLHNSAKQGTIVKVTNTANGKSIYAKVLDMMPDLKQNDKLVIRISNAAADALGETTATTINVEISF